MISAKQLLGVEHEYLLRALFVRGNRVLAQLAILGRYRGIGHDKGRGGLSMNEPPQTKMVYAGLPKHAPALPGQSPPSLNHLLFKAIKHKVMMLACHRAIFARPRCRLRSIAGIRKKLTSSSERKCLALSRPNN